MLTFLAAYWIEIVLGIVIAGVVGYFAYLVYTKQIDKIQQWLLIAVAEAESYIGSGKGREKLKWVYDSFTKKYPILRAFISFDKFSKMVDVALDELEQLIK